MPTLLQTGLVFTAEILKNFWGVKICKFNKNLKFHGKLQIYLTTHNPKTIFNFQLVLV
jgi:hypothetical protein